MRSDKQRARQARPMAGQAVSFPLTNQDLAAGDASWSVAVQKACIMAVLVFLGLYLWQIWDEWLVEMEFFMARQESSPWLWPARTALSVSSWAAMWSIWLAMTYKSAPEATDAQLPTVTIVIPAYNEGAQVMRSLLSVAASDYPVHKMQIIAVDDGSTDDTWEWMQKGAAQSRIPIELIRQPRNGGKRKALYTGFLKATGDILVTIDSDSEITAQTLRRLMDPMVHEPKVGAVAGNVRVLNVHKGVIPRMLDAGFTFGFDYIRAGQSRINTVLTTPGALSAYRRAVVEPFLDGWLHQTFLGRPAGIGEDRAMTNIVLRQGFYAQFARRAVVYTEVPTTYKGTAKMFLRWARSNLRETLTMTKYIFRNFRQGWAIGPRVLFALAMYNLTVVEFIKLTGMTVVLSAPYIMGFNLLMGVLMGGMFPAFIYALSRRTSNFLWAFPYVVFSVLGLGWISMYALITPHKSGWLTRGLGSTLHTA